MASPPSAAWRMAATSLGGAPPAAASSRHWARCASTMRAVCASRWLKVMLFPYLALPVHRSLPPMPRACLFLAVRCIRRKTIRWEGCGHVDERGQDREWGGGDAPTTRTVEPARDQPSSECRTESTEPAAAVPLALWPRAAGGGAGAVSAPVLPNAASPSDERAIEPAVAPAERAIEPARPDICRPSSRRLSAPGNPETGLRAG